VARGASQGGRLLSNPEGLSMKQAESVFLKHFPQSFEDPEYIGDLKTGELDYKLMAHQL
jgi:hypothetical protein